MGDDVISVESAAAGMYHISVTAYFQTSQFSLTATVSPGGGGGGGGGDDSPVITLVNGSPQDGAVAVDLYQYYYLAVAGEGSRPEVRVVASPKDGDIDVYVSVCEGTASRCADIRPRAGAATWSSDESLSQEEVKISSDDPEACVSCTYVVGVRGQQSALLPVSAGQRINYTITATAGDHITTLREGKPLRTSVDRHEYAYFAFELSAPHEDVIFLLTPFSGDPDLAVSFCGPEWPATAAGTCEKWRQRPTIVRIDNYIDSWALE